VPPIRILIVEDQELVRCGIARLLDGPDFEVVADASNLEEGIRKAAELQPDVTLLDFLLGNGARGSDFLPEAERLGYRGKVLVVSASLSDPEALQLLRQGVRGIFLKDASPEMLAAAIRTVAHGDVWLNRHHLDLLLNERSPHDHEDLNERETEVMRRVFEGQSNKEIGVSLGISEPAVKRVIQQLFGKTGVRTRGQLVRVAVERYGYPVSRH
jgi:two-component system, NarL family, nitrate/nitrite response regulator NarL